jgi:ABC-type glycerol-3-phosphate transport system substrate-binding protein
MSNMTKNARKRVQVCSFAILLFMFILAACSPQGAVIVDSGSETATPGGDIDGELATPSQSVAESGPLTLTLWLPPSFSPFSGDLPATLLQDRLDEFHEMYPNVQVEIRLKLEGGSGGMLDSLINALSAAPLALPDLVLISSDQAQVAIQNQLLAPLSDFRNDNFSDDWYKWGLQIVQFEGEDYGLPFAGDALVLAHRFSAIEQIPSNWSTSLDASLSIGFAAADPEALFTQVQLLALMDSEPLPSDSDSINPDLMQEILNYYSDGQAIGIFPFWLTQQSWQAYIEGRTPMVATWSSRFFASNDDNLGAGTIPTMNGQSATLAKGWAWSLTSANSERTALAYQLGEFLSQAEFMAQWTAAANLLPARESALTAWTPDKRQVLALQVAPGAEILPPSEERTAKGNAISEAVISLLKQEISSVEAGTLIQNRLNEK